MYTCEVHRFAIDSSVLGTEKHLVGDEEGFLWSDSVPRDAWHMTGDLKTSSTARCLDTLFKMSGHKAAEVPERYLLSMKSLVTGSNSIPWQMVLPQSVFKQFFKNVVRETTEVFPNLPFDYYETAWAAGSRVLNSLRPCAIDLDAFNDAVAQNPASPGLESFRPKRSGFSRPVVYDRFATRTGRLTVIDGPNILILKKENRRVIKSSFEDGIIAYLDFRALEARIVLGEAGRYSTSDDLYEDVANSQFKGVLPRDVVKVAVLSELYGISRSSLKSRLGVSDQKLDSFIGVIRDYFKVNELRNLLKDQVGNSGKMINRFGRPLTVPIGQDNLLVNTYAQSTGVDVSLLGFDYILRNVGSEGIRPLFVLHDAIIIDVRGDRIDDVKKIGNVSIPTYDSPFPVKFEQLSAP
jgi:hypothetical protein